MPQTFKDPQTLLFIFKTLQHPQNISSKVWFVTQSKTAGQVSSSCLFIALGIFSGLCLTIWRPRKTWTIVYVRNWLWLLTNHFGDFQTWSHFKATSLNLLRDEKSRKWKVKRKKLFPSHSSYSRTNIIGGANFYFDIFAHQGFLGLTSFFIIRVIPSRFWEFAEWNQNKLISQMVHNNKVWLFFCFKGSAWHEN